MSESEEKVWFAHAGGVRRGPMSRAQLDAMAADGELAADDLVWESGTPDWVAAGGVVAFGRRATEPPPGPPPPPAPPPFPAPVAAPAEASAVPLAPSAVPAARVAGLAAESAAPAAPATHRVPWSEPLRDRVARDLEQVEARELFPLTRIAEPEALGVPSTWALLAFGLAPLFLAAVVEDPVLRIRLFRLGVGAAWAAFLLGAFRPAAPPVRLGVATFAAGGILAALLVTLLPGVPPLAWLVGLAQPAHAWPLRLLASLVTAGVLAEGGKLLALLLLARVVGGLVGPAEGLWAGLAGGLGFGIWEAASSVTWAGPRSEGLLALVREPSAGLEALVVAGLGRAVALPALEAAWGGLAGYGAGLAAARRAPAVAAAGLVVPALLHAAYAALDASDRGVGALVVAALSLILLVAARRAAGTP